MTYIQEIKEHIRESRRDIFGFKRVLQENRYLLSEKTIRLINEIIDDLASEELYLYEKLKEAEYDAVSDEFIDNDEVDDLSEYLEEVRKRRFSYKKPSKNLLREAIIEATIDEEKDAHKRHIKDQKNYYWYYSDGSIQKIEKDLNDYSTAFNKEAVINNKTVKYCSYKITDDKTDEIIGWFNYIIHSIKRIDGSVERYLNTVKLKLENPELESDCIQQVINHFVSLFQNNTISSISWETDDDGKNKRVRQYKNLCNKFDGEIYKNNKKKRIRFFFSEKAFTSHKDNIMRYFRLT